MARSSTLFLLSFSFLIASASVASAPVLPAAKVDHQYFYTHDANGNWVKTYLKGVNVGSGMPGKFPGEFGITKAMYLRWFGQISSMNANVIRVYTLLSPVFYEALYDFNKGRKNPLMLLQGVWVDENDMINIGNAHDPRIKEAFVRDSKTLVDVVHGRGDVPPQRGHASGQYRRDISPYVIGWLLGVEWDPDFVLGTNKANPGYPDYSGTYLSSLVASPFEVFLAEVGDRVATYEITQWGQSRPISFVNWPTTDPLKHPNEPIDREDWVEVNQEHIHASEAFEAGLFASYHIYPYYPDSLKFQADYRGLLDSEGRIDTFKAYLRDLRKVHTVPVIVAEYGVPSARGVAHTEPFRGFNQGGLNEIQQGEMAVSMFRDIYDEGYAGGVLFSWQDEWFKRTWNTMDYDLPERRAYWSNPQSTEQVYGVLAFDPGKTNLCIVDGNPKEWSGSHPVSENGGVKTFVRSDEKYLYIMVDARSQRPLTPQFVVAIDSLPGQGNFKSVAHDLSFNREADFLVEVDPVGISRIMVDPRYDVFYALNAHHNPPLVPLEVDHEFFTEGTFVPTRLILSRKLFLPVDMTTIPAEIVETGMLRTGNGNLRSRDYDSLTDYAYSSGVLEIRIPWELMNFMDPSEGQIISGFGNGVVSQFNPLHIEAIHLGGGLANSSTMGALSLGTYSLHSWDLPNYHERLKPAYYILRGAYATY
jgi:hypothetical protein